MSPHRPALRMRELRCVRRENDNQICSQVAGGKGRNVVSMRQTV